MSNRVTSKNFESHANFRMYVDQVTAVYGSTVRSNIGDGEYEISAALRRPADEDLETTVRGLVQYAQDPEDFSATFDGDGFDVAFKAQPDQAANLQRNIEPVVRQAIKDFMTGPRKSTSTEL